jgi:glyoxalase family protein
VNFDEPSVLHFYCGDTNGSPGALLTFFIHEGATRGRRGTGQAISIALAVSPGALEEWRRHLVAEKVEVTGRAWAFGEEYLCFTDPDGLELALIEDADSPHETSSPGSSDTTERTIRRIRSVEIQTEGFQCASRFLVETMGFRALTHEGALFRFQDGPAERPVAIDLLCTPNHRPGSPGPGVVHHVAWRVPDADALNRMSEILTSSGFDITPPLDRYYFRAIYFRTPCGLSFAIATDGPGFGVDNRRSDKELSPALARAGRAAIERRITRRSPRARSARIREART